MEFLGYTIWFLIFLVSIVLYLSSRNDKEGQKEREGQGDDGLSRESPDGATSDTEVEETVSCIAVSTSTAYSKPRGNDTSHTFDSPTSYHSSYRIFKQSTGDDTCTSDPVEGEGVPRKRKISSAFITLRRPSSETGGE